jgi:hypothetical protein
MNGSGRDLDRYDEVLAHGDGEDGGIGRSPHGGLDNAITTIDGRATDEASQAEWAWLDALREFNEERGE